ncbi:nicotinate phosphoribosyltransferase [Serendipita sp. 399]|nr:nicotinate phosphoribosyltransferase [Serendipita sp. 399]
MAQINSILDTDLYKLTMQQAVLHQFPTAIAKYRFTNRSPNMTFTIECLELLKQAVGKLRDLRLTPDEKQWLSEACPYFTGEYLDYLEAYRFKPDQVTITFIPNSGDATKGQIEMEATGPWVETIMWEIVLMALLSEIYFQVVDTDWNNEGQETRAFEKGKDLLLAGCTFSEFGTRRRRSFKVQEEVVLGLIRAEKELKSESHSGKLYTWLKRMV